MQAAPQRTPASGSLPIAQRHTPSVQVEEAGQARPQAPQLALSEVSDTQEPAQRLWAPGQGVTHMLSLHTWPEGQARPQAPQWFWETRVSISQPSSGVVLQSAKPVLQAIEQRPAAQRGVAWGPATQGARQAPQFSVSVLRSDSQPLATLPSQSPRPPAQVVVHTPREHMPMPQERPQVPQFAPLVSVFTSQPFMGFMSQSAKPAAHVTTVQAPAAQPCSATLSSAQALPQRPQCWALVAVLVSQPVVESPSQSPKPALHVSIAQALIRHAADALRTVQVRRQAPQFIPSERASVSQPLVASPSQSTNPSAHCSRHAPITQAPTELVPAGHRMPQAPQFIASVWRFTSQPFIAPMSQSEYGAVHMRMPHAPIAQEAAPLGTRQVVPQAPQAATLLCVSMQAPSQHDRPVGHARAALQPDTQVEPRQRAPAGQWSSVTHCTHMCVTVSQRPVAPPPSTPPSPPAAAQPSSRLHPATHAPVAGLQYSVAGHSAAFDMQLTQAPEAVSHTGRPSCPAHIALDVHRAGGASGASIPASAATSGAASSGVGVGELVQATPRASRPNSSAGLLRTATFE